MIYRSKAPLRIGLAGGGTDISPFCDLYGGAILNATINLYARASIICDNSSHIVLHAIDRGIYREYPISEEIAPEKGLELHAGVYNRIVKQFTHQPIAMRLETYVDVPPGSGLGTSSALVVAILGAFTEMLSLPLGEYDMAQLAYEIERQDLGMPGGRQDQYAATFGGFNFMEFYKDNKVIVNPLRIRQRYLDELSHDLVLFYTQTSRESNHIIENQAKAIATHHKLRTEATMKLKEQAFMMKEAILKGELRKLGEILNFGWEHKKLIADGITNEQIDRIYTTALRNGAIGGKISGAGGGGFMTFYCPENYRYQLIEALKPFGGFVVNYEFTQQGLSTWSF